MAPHLAFVAPLLLPTPATYHRRAVSPRAPPRPSPTCCDEPPKAPASPPYRAENAAECARDFLTQRAVQQTVFCAYMLRDETTARWLEAFLGHIGLHDLHACDALRLPSRDYIVRLMNAPPEHLTIKKPIPGRTNRKNPYLKRRYLEYDVDVIPRNIARRVLSARLQIAEELTEDLETIRTDSDRLTEQHRRQVLAQQSGDGGNDLSIDLPPTAERSGSPYRSATLDLAQNYTLYHALRGAARGRGDDASWLDALLLRRAGDLLRPYGGERGVSDSVVRDLLSASPAVRDDGSLFDPGSVAQRVLEERVACVDEWLGVVTKAADEHLDIERSVLEKDMK